MAEAILIRESRSAGLDAADPEAMRTFTSRPEESKPVKPKRKLTPELRKEAMEALKLVRIADPEQVLERYPFELSGGMRQRVMIAMALSQRPKLLVADEPTTALDVTTQAQVLKLMKELITEVNTSIMLITHDLAVASQVADRVVVMYAGDVVEDAGVYDLFSKPLHPYTKGLLWCIPTRLEGRHEAHADPRLDPDLVIRPWVAATRTGARLPWTSAGRSCAKLAGCRFGHKVSCFYGE